MANRKTMTFKMPSFHEAPIAEAGTSHPQHQNVSISWGLEHLHTYFWRARRVLPIRINKGHRMKQNAMIYLP